VLLPPVSSASVCRKQLKARDSRLTFEAEGAASLSAFYAVQPSDLYFSDDTICMRVILEVSFLLSLLE
jgi:hypothetical protein